ERPDEAAVLAAEDHVLHAGRDPADQELAREQHPAPVGGGQVAAHALELLRDLLGTTLAQRSSSGSGLATTPSDSPPSITNMAPVAKLDASEARNCAHATMSAGCPTRPTACRVATSARALAGSDCESR